MKHVCIINRYGIDYFMNNKFYVCLILAYLELCSERTQILSMETEPPKTYFGYTLKQLACCFICYYAFLAFGGTDASKSVYLPLIQKFYHLEYDYQGLLVFTASLGYTLFSLFVGYLTVKIGIRWTLSIGFLIMVLSYSVGIAIVHIGCIVTVLVIAGIGMVFLDVGINTWATVLFQSHKATMMNLLHCFYGLGATIGPIFTGFISLHLKMSYRGVLIAILGICGTALLATLFIPKSESKTEEVESSSESTFTIRTALCHPGVWLMGLAQGCIAGTENITMNWAPVYLRDLYGWDPETKGAGFVSAFFLVYTISRLVSGFLIDRLGGIRSLVIYICTLICVFVTGFILGEKGVYCLIASGFFIAPLFPTLLTIAMTYFGKDVDKCTCVIMFMYMIVSQTIQLLVGVIMKRVGVEWGYRLVVLLMVIVLVDVLVINNRLKKKQESLLSTQQPLVLSVSYRMRCTTFFTLGCPCNR